MRNCWLLSSLEAISHHVTRLMIPWHFSFFIFHFAFPLFTMDIPHRGSHFQDGVQPRISAC